MAREHLDHPAQDLDPGIWVTHEVADAASGIEEELLGTKEKFWVTRSQDNRPWLLKLARGEGAATRGEDWAEWVVHRLAESLGVPSASVVPARWRGRRGILSRSIVNRDVGERLVHGNERLAEQDPEYDAGSGRANSRYTVQSVREALVGIGPPVARDGSLSQFTAFDAWAGYLMMDALVAGRDRHHENWGVVRSSSGAALAPSFDHGNALGFQESDEVRERLLADEDLLQRWTRRGRSRHFAGRPRLDVLAKDARDLASRGAGRYWWDRLRGVSALDVEAAVVSIPSDVMSEAARRFAAAVVRENRRRLLDEHSA